MTDSEIKKALKCCSKRNLLNDTCPDCPYSNKIYPNLKACSSVLAGDLIDLINRQQEMIDALIAGQETLQKALASKQAKIEALQMDNAQLQSDIINARMNLEHLRELYEERAALCEEQERQLFELNLILACYPYVVHFGNGVMCTENHKEYERLLASISVNAVNEVLEELKNTLVINNEGNTEFFDYVYTLETIEGLKNKGVIFNV